MISLDPFPVLETPRLILRELQISDAEAIFRNQSDPLVARYLGRDPDATIDRTRQRVQLAIDSVKDHSGIRWALTRRDDPMVIGTVGFWKWNTAHFCAEAGYEIGPAHWNKGYMTEALGAALRFGFDHLELHRVEANIDPRNDGSRRVLEKLGFTREALFRENWFYRGQFLDSAIYGLLAHEFPAKQV